MDDGACLGPGTREVSSLIRWIARLFLLQRTSNRVSSKDTDMGGGGCISEHQVDIVWPRLFPRRVSGRGAMGIIQPTQSFGLGVRCGRRQPSKRYAIQLCRVLTFPSATPYQRSLTGHARLTSLLAYATTRVMNGGGIQGALDQ